MNVGACLALALCVAGASPPATVDAPILVQFDQQALAKLPDWGGTVEGLLAGVAPLLELPEGACLSETALSQMGRKESAAPDFSRWMILSVPAMPYEQPAIEQLVQQLADDPLIAHAELDHDAAGWSPKPDFGPVPAYPGRMPNDPLFKEQYYLHQIHAPEAWDITTGSPAITVAVLDSGFDVGLVELDGRQEAGYDFVSGGPIVTDDTPHGTAIASIIAAAGDNGQGIAGIAWQCRILPVQMTLGGVAVWAQAIDYAVSQGVDIINISGKLDLHGPSDLLDAAIERAAKAGIVIVASAGNLDREEIAWPASSPHVIAVGATNGFDARWKRPLNVGSNYGAGLDLVAPGGSIVSLSKVGRRSQGEGTSPAAAMVSGACALMLSVNPKLTPAEVRAILRETADKIGPPEAWHDGASNEFGSGRLNVLKAVKAAQKKARR